jgi:hypothetical protein
MSFLDEFNKVQEQIEDNVSIAELEAQTNERIEFENIYFETMTAIATAIESYDKTKVAATNNNQNSTAIQSHQNSKINLPVIQIPEFSGHFEKWLWFRDVFQSLIHNNNNLNSIEKMHSNHHYQAMHFTQSKISPLAERIMMKHGLF